MSVSLKEIRNDVIFVLIFGVAVFSVAYIKKPFTCSANIRKVETILRDLPFFDDSVKLSKPERIKYESGVLYCITSATDTSGHKIDIPYTLTKTKYGISVYIDTDYLYNDRLLRVFGL